MSKNTGDQGLRLEQARIRRGFKTRRAACNYYGWNYDTYIQHERSERGIGKMAARYAQAYQVSEAWLLTGEGSIESISAVLVPLISWVSAGHLKTPEAIKDITNASMINAGDLPKGGEWLALTVQGDSMDRISPPGSIIVLNRRECELVSGACYVIQEDDGAATYKRFKDNPPRFEPVSSNAEHETFFPDQSITVIGRVRKTVLEM
jgi:SOS-response transcriptional repressor LexA